MSLHFHKLKIKDIRKETGDCISIAFYIPEELKDIYSFSHGQNITLRSFINGEDIRRSYSICTAPYENELRIAVKKAEFGLFSRFVHEQLKKDDEINVLPPTGKFFTKLNVDHKKNYLAFAAGSGITPVISIIKAVLKNEPGSGFTLVYGNRNRSSVIFLEELEALKNLYLSRFNFIPIMSREETEIPIHSGRINTLKLEELGSLIEYKKMDEIFICGPEELIFSTEKFLIEKGVNREKIHFELFFTPGTANRTKNKEQKTETKETGLTSIVTIKIDGRSFDFELAYDGETILNAALKQSADLPFACKGGVCASCRARLIKGKVEMEMNWALEPEEIEQGYILTCQSHPVTKKIEIDFDNR